MSDMPAMTPTAALRTHAAVPGPSEAIQIAPGVLWMRLALPFALNHVNVYALDDGDGWTLIDTGIGDAPTQLAWEALLAGPLSGRRVNRLVCTHHHPDHFGMAGALSRRLDAPLAMPMTEFLLAAYYMHTPYAISGAHYVQYYLSNGLTQELTGQVMSVGHRYQHLCTGAPETFERLAAGQVLRVGGRNFVILTGGGHSAEQCLLLNRDEGLLLAADQILPRITPNIGVLATEPTGNPLGEYLASLAALAAGVPRDTVVLPGHDWPFRGLQARIAQLTAHHDERCARIVDACRAAPRTAADLVPVLFHRPLDLHQMSFAFAETLAHANHLVAEGALELWTDAQGVRWMRAA